MTHASRTLRLAVAVFCLATAAYGVLNCSPFAFDMFIRPQLFPWITQFVTWHHVGLTAAYVAALATLTHQLDRRNAPTPRARWAHLLAVAFALVFGVLVTTQLLFTPFLPTLWNDHRALPTVLAALAPLLWLSAIDHLSVPAGILERENRSWKPLPPERLLFACAASAILIWSVTFGRALVRADGLSLLAWVGTAVWTQVLIVAAFAVVYAIGRGSSRLAARSRTPHTMERAVLGVATAVGVAEFLRRFVLPTLGLEGWQSAVIGAALGITISWTWSGLARGNASDTHALLSGRHPRWSMPRASVYLAALLLTTLWGLSQIERIDWAFVAQRTIVVVSWVAAFLIVLNTKRPARTSRAARPLLAAMAAAAVVAFVTPQALAAYAATTAEARWQADDVLDRYSGGDVGVRLLLRAFAGGTDFDPDYYRLLQVQSGFAGPVTVTAPAVEFSSAVKVRGPRKPDVFVISVDSLRRDYLAPYNPKVGFTPAIADFAKDSYVFSNAFTRHGGTELAIPSMWAGAMVVRQLRSAGFERMNAFEKLVQQEGYRLVLNDFTIADNLRADTPVTRLNPGVASIDTDLCGNLRELESVLSGSGAGREPVFAFLAPMNVHILNTQRGGQASLDGDYPGFFAPYASRLRRVDACFGNFISFLRQTGRYDDAMIVLTTDHGDSLGEDGYWGHSTWLTPEIIRIPLVIKVPQALRAGLTTDLDRIAFSTDIAPTLYSVLQHDVRDLGPFFGAPLFAPQGGTLPDRRSQSFLVTASYGPAYGIVAGNGRSLYVTDLLERREVFYDMSKEARSRALTVPADVREGSQQEIRRQVLEIGALYQLQGRAAPGRGGKVVRTVETRR